MRSFIVAAIIGLGSLPHALAWGINGHEIVATIAQSYLKPHVLKTVCSILAEEGGEDDKVRADAPCYLSNVANWADKIRWRAKWSGPYHFVNGKSDHPPDKCGFPGKEGWAGKERANILDGINNVTTILTDFAQGSSTAGAPELAQEALKFLVHFLGDMHQPLHLCGRDKGGNKILVHWDNRQTNLHHVWDVSLIDKAIQSTPDKYSRPVALPDLEATLRGAAYDPYVRRIVWEGLGSKKPASRWASESKKWLSCKSPTGDTESAVDAEWAPPQEVLAAPPKPKWRGPPTTSDSDILCPYAWGAPIHQLNCDIVWPAGIDSPETEGRPPRKDLLELDTPEYSGSIEEQWIVEKLLAQGGWRLAGILNRIFSQE